MARPVYFISDAHLGSSADPRTDEPRLERLVPFLRHVGDQGAERLYILGDLFDFWFEYKHVMPRRHVRILTEIRALVDRGVPVTFFGGNHDWWAGDTFREVAGMSLEPDPVTVEHQGLKLYLAHGDGLASKADAGYLMLKRVIRNPFVIRLMRLVHPDFAYSMGHRLSKFSRNHLTAGEFRIDPPLAEFVDLRFREGHHAFLMGHLHARYAEERASGGKLFILGDWMQLYCALRLEDGQFVWEDWSGGEPAPMVDPVGAECGGHGD